ncbi:MAG: helix-turn-helix domain-containing protein [Verrucomicrobia bacterium]|nr:helix-turn-helix domain-containing protein [Verrucomicrobiota bacterium]
MASIGQKLEEARNRKGISIREAEEATKIRGHFLASFEKDAFDVDLPPVYLSGFLKNYARFLGLDPEAVLAELDVLLPSRSGKTAKKSLGSITSSSEGGETEGASGSTTQSAATEPRRGSPLSNSRQTGTQGVLKPVIVITSGALILVGIIVALVYVLSKPDAPSSPPNNSAITERGTTAADSDGGASVKKITLRLAAYGPIERLILSDDGAKPSQKKYYDRQSLKAGWEESFSINGSFRCYSSSLENIRYIINDGQELVPKKSGKGSFVWPLEKE